MSLLKVMNLKVSYGGIEALKGISFEVEKGSIVTLIGANGAGKSTTLRAISGLVPVKSGTITYDGNVINGQSPQKIVSEGICMVPEGRRVFPNLTVLENLKIGAYLRKDDLTEDLNWVYDLFPRLRERSWQSAGTLSGGEQQRVALARALVNKPAILLADEPTGNLDPNNSWEIMKLMEQINENGTTVIVVTHNREIVNAMKKRVITMKKGVIIEDEEEGMYIDED